MDTKFKIIIPVYNSEKWVKQCLESVVKQTYKNWNAILVNDSSTDKTLEIAVEYLKNCEMVDNFRVLSRTKNVGALENIVKGIQTICDNDEDVVVLLDGDDWLHDDNVLAYLNEQYQGNILTTYGSFMSVTGAHNGFCRKINSLETYRNDSWVSSHLRTFKWKLWRRINDVDLKDKYGRYYDISWDLAIMYPILEMAGLHRIKFIDKILYVYNDSNPLNDFKKNITYQISVANEIRKKPKYTVVNF